VKLLTYFIELKKPDKNLLKVIFLDRPCQIFLDICLASSSSDCRPFEQNWWESSSSQTIYNCLKKSANNIILRKHTHWLLLINIFYGYKIECTLCTLQSLIVSLNSLITSCWHVVMRALNPRNACFFCAVHERLTLLIRQNNLWMSGAKCSRKRYLHTVNNDFIYQSGFDGVATCLQVGVKVSDCFCVISFWINWQISNNILPLRSVGIKNYSL
jgi:hypothetical protein